MKDKIREFAGRGSVGTSGKRMACEPGKKVKKYRLGESARRGARTESERRGARKKVNESCINIVCK